MVADRSPFGLELLTLLDVGSVCNLFPLVVLRAGMLGSDCNDH